MSLVDYVYRHFLNIEAMTKRRGTISAGMESEIERETQLEGCFGLGFESSCWTFTLLSIYRGTLVFLL